MKVFKYIFYTISILLLAGCAAIGILALNPGMTEKLAGAFYKGEDEAQTENGSENNGEDQGESEVSGESAGEGGPGASDNIDGSVEISEVDAYINPDPQKPFTWQSTWNGNPEKEDASEEDRLAEAGITKEEVLDTMKAYYEDCLEQFKKAGAGEIQFTNVIPEALWPSVEQAYTDNSFRKQYVEKGLEELKMEYFAIQLQAQRLGGGYYRLYHNIATWN